MQLISKFEELSTLDKEIENLIDIESLEEEIVTREEYRDKFIIWKIRAERYVESVSNTAIQNSVGNQPQNITLPLNSTVSSVLSNQPRLPKLTLESFSGKDISVDYDYVREGIVERTSCDSLLDSQGFYLPHHAVIRSDKTTSHIRIVFDGSAHEDGQSSLNQKFIYGTKFASQHFRTAFMFSKKSCSIYS
ncbi:uncharacterized protein TNCV_3243021 [Trichonephila clavipes]|nr:uncharacterized protein TNCV_3243021 [Trichonephila clavipes]